jgi:hypothetical protein
LIDAGGDYIDELRNLIGKTTDWEGTPDNNVADIGFHYFNWYYVNAGDSNGLSADLNQDGIVNFKDFAILADYWQQSTTAEADLDGSGFVDYLDLVLFAKEWLTETGVYVEGYSFETHQAVDFNNASGDFSIGPRDIPSYTDKVFIYVDDEQVSRWEREIDEWNDFLESNKFINGQHTIRLVSVNQDGSVKNYPPTSIYFNNLLYKVSDDDKQYYPDRNYHYSGYYDGGNLLDATLTGLYDNVIWSNTYCGSYIDVNIPGPAFGEEKICNLSINETLGGMMEAMQEGGIAMASSSSGSEGGQLKKDFKWEDCGNPKMVILAPHDEIAASRAPAIKACMEACDACNVPWCYLEGHEVNSTNLFRLLPPIGSNVKYIYYAGHADCNVVSEDKKTSVRRTCIGCWRYDPDAWLFKWEKIHAFSKSEPETPLPDDWDYRGFNLWTTGMHESNKKKIIFIDGCNSALHYFGRNNDMAEAFGMFSLAGQGTKDQIYIGWKAPVAQAQSIWDKIADDTTAGIKLFWERMGAGDNVGAALWYTCQNPPDSKCQMYMWGPNFECEIYNDGGDDRILLWGLGCGYNLYKIKLEPY